MQITQHAFQRLKERVNSEITTEDAIKLAAKAYHQGKTSAHFIETDTEMFDYLMYKQSKYLDKNVTIRLLNDMLYIYDLDKRLLITCYQIDFELWRKNNKNKKRYLQKTKYML